MTKLGGVGHRSCAHVAALVVGAAFSLSLASTAMAQDATATQQAQGGRDAPKGWSFTIGAGAGVAPDYEGSDDYTFVPIPVLRADWDNRFIELFGFKVTSNVINHPNWRLGPAFNFRNGYNGIEDDRVSDLTNRGSTMEGGLVGGYVLPLFEESSLDLSLLWLHALGGKGHDGWTFEPSVTFASPITERWGMSLGSTFAYSSGNFNSHFFSVNSSEAASARLDNFDADANARTFAINGSVSYKITDSWNVTALAEWKKMLSNANDSPVVDQRGSGDQGFFGVFTSYTF